MNAIKLFTVREGKLLSYRTGAPETFTYSTEGVNYANPEHGKFVCFSDTIDGLEEAERLISHWPYDDYEIWRVEVVDLVDPPSFSYPPIFQHFRSDYVLAGAVRLLKLLRTASPDTGVVVP